MSQKKHAEPTVAERLYREDVKRLRQMRNDLDVVREFGVPHIRPTVALVVHYLVRNATCPECGGTLPRGRCTACDKSGL